jgi:hypothetical protein
MGKLGAVHACGAQAHGDLRGVGGAIDMQIAGKVAAPAGIGAGNKARELAQTRVAPV